MSPDVNGTPTRQDIKRALLVIGDFPALIRETRKRRGHTVRDVAEKTGATASNMSLIERGITHPTVPTIVEILKYLAQPDPRRTAQ